MFYDALYLLYIALRTTAVKRSVTTRCQKTRTCEPRSNSSVEIPTQLFNLQGRKYDYPLICRFFSTFLAHVRVYEYQN